MQKIEKNLNYNRKSIQPLNTTKMKTATYVPPSLRKQQQQQKKPVPVPVPALAPIKLAKKTEPKKEFQLDNNENFPLLGETLKQKQINGTPISFSKAAGKKNEVLQPKEIESTGPPPGWVYIRRQNGKFQYKTGDLTRLNNWLADDEERTFIKDNKQLCKYQLERQQYERDMDVVCLGDFSEYYGEITLAEMMECEYMNELQNKNNNAYSDYSSGSDSYMSD